MGPDRYFGGDRPGRENPESERSYLLTRFDDLLSECIQKQSDLSRLIASNERTSSSEDTNRLANVQEILEDCIGADKDAASIDELSSLVRKLELAARNVDAHIRTYKEKS